MAKIPIPESMLKSMALTKAIKTIIEREYSDYTSKMAICGCLVNGFIKEDIMSNGEEEAREQMNLWLRYVESGFDLVEICSDPNNN